MWGSDSACRWSKVGVLAEGPGQSARTESDWPAADPPATPRRRGRAVLLLSPPSAEGALPRRGRAGQPQQLCPPRSHELAAYGGGRRRCMRPLLRHSHIPAWRRPHSVRPSARGAPPCAHCSCGAARRGGGRDLHNMQSAVSALCCLTHA